MSVYDKLKDLGITLPPVSTPAAAYVPFVRTGNLVFLSGHIARKDGKPWVGQLGAGIDTEEGKQAARASFVGEMGPMRSVFTSVVSPARAVAFDRLGGAAHHRHRRTVADAARASACPRPPVDCGLRGRPEGGARRDRLAAAGRAVAVPSPRTVPRSARGARETAGSKSCPVSTTGVRQTAARTITYRREAYRREIEDSLAPGDRPGPEAAGAAPSPEKPVRR